MVRRDTAHLVNMGSKATIRILDTDETLQEGLTELGRLDPVIARIIAEGARPALRKREPGFHGLAWIVMSQQLSASADAIWTRLVGRLGPLSPATIEAAQDEVLKVCGLSAPKIGHCGQWPRRSPAAFCR
jgi:DNA-3-methyladenine glycosylase II